MIISTLEMEKFGLDEVKRACRESAYELGYDTLRDEQLRVLTTFVRGSDDFVILPTGYGAFDTLLKTKLMTP